MHACFGNLAWRRWRKWRKHGENSENCKLYNSTEAAA